MQNSARRISPIEGFIVIALVFWLFFMGGLGQLKKAKVTDTLTTGVQRIVATSASAATDTATTEKDTKELAAGGAPRITLPVGQPAAAPAGQSVVSTQPTAAAVPTSAAAVPTVAVVAAAQPAVAPIVVGLVVPEGQHTDIHPDGSFTINSGNWRYYPDSSGTIVERRLIGSEDYLKTLPTEAPVPTAQPYVAPTRLPNASACRRGCPKVTP